MFAFRVHYYKRVHKAHNASVLAGTSNDEVGKAEGIRVLRYNTEH